jgi:hypothetical protein
MNKLYHSFPLKCFDQLKKETLEYMSQFNSDRVYIKPITISDELTEVFNKEMVEYGLPHAWNFLCFKRKWYILESPNFTHVDHSFTLNESVHGSIVVPAEGCDNTSMYWYNGEYELEHMRVATGNSAYSILKWKSDAKFLDRVEINKEPILTKVDVPHGATSRRDGSYRTILSIRLQGNPDFDEIIKKRFDNNSVV